MGREGVSTKMEYTTSDGFTLRVFSSCYLDWGLEITNSAGKEMYYNPCCLSSDCWGSHYDEELDEVVEWCEDEWREELKLHADDLIDCFVQFDNV
jgi:hypothetical protein